MLLDFGKVGMPTQTHQRWLGQGLQLLTKNANGVVSFLVEIATPAITWQQFGAPQVVWLQVDVQAGQLNFTLTLVNKTATRLAESLWLCFQPLVSQSQQAWSLDKLGSLVSPFDVVGNGSRHLHGLDRILYNDTHSFVFSAIDSPIFSIGALNAMPVPFTEPNLAQYGFNANLVNNIWGTNYIMWYPFGNASANLQYRFTLSF